MTPVPFARYGVPASAGPLIFLLTIFAAQTLAAEPPTIPVGADAYLQWEKWPQQRIGVRAYMRSTYDRTGGNRSADASHYLYQLADDNNISLDVAGKGILYFARYNHWHGSPWRYAVDGKETIVKETSTADPLHPATNSIFLPQNLFPAPLAVTWAETKGADLSWVPISFENTFRMGYSRTRYGTGYYIYHLYQPGASLSQPIKSWNDHLAPDPRLLELFSRAGSDLSPTNNPTESRGVAEGIGSGQILGEESIGPGVIRKISLSAPKDQALALGHARIRITWDGRKEPSVDAPIALLFGAGTLYNRDNREYLVKAFPVNIRFTNERVELACYFPMPYFKSYKFELIGPKNETVRDVHWAVRSVPFDGAPENFEYFHSTYKDHGEPERGKDLVLLDTTKMEGGGDWSGSFVGMSWIFSERAFLGTLEGDPRFFFDDSESPQAQGTGTEEWGGGGDYWGGLNMTLPFAGHPCGARNPQLAKNDEDKIESAYRFLLGDLMPFGKNARIQLEHGGVNESTEHYQSVVYWYGAPAPALVKTDELKVADEASEKSHSYKSPKASAPYEITSRYELGPDTIRFTNGTETVIYPPHTERGRKHADTSEFTLKIDPKNVGVMLRRKLDYQFPNQRAEVFVNGKAAGIWYLAGGNTCVYSDARGELGETQHNVIVSNRRFRDDEFLLPRDLTRGKSSIRVRIKFTPVNIPLFPGHPQQELAWSEIRYDAYCYVIPNWRP